MDEVLEEKFIFSTTYFSIGILLKCEKIVTVLAVPESPTNIAGLFIDMTWLRSQEYRLVSTVGTKIYENFLFRGGSYS